MQVLLNLSIWVICPRFFLVLNTGPVDCSLQLHISSLDPEAVLGQSGFMKLAEKLPNVVSCENLGRLDMETAAYRIDKQVTPM